MFVSHRFGHRLFFFYMKRFYSLQLDYGAICFVDNHIIFLKKQCIGFVFELNFHDLKKSSRFSIIKYSHFWNC